MTTTLDLSRLTPRELIALGEATAEWLRESAAPDEYPEGTMPLGEALDAMIDRHGGAYSPDDDAEWLDLAPEDERPVWLRAHLIGDLVTSRANDPAFPFGPVDVAEVLMDRL